MSAPSSMSSPAGELSCPVTSTGTPGPLAVGELDEVREWGRMLRG